MFELLLIIGTYAVFGLICLFLIGLPVVILYEIVKFLFDLYKSIKE